MLKCQTFQTFFMKKILSMDKITIGSFLAAAGFFVIFEVIFFYKLIQVFDISHSYLVILYVIFSTLFLLSRPILAFFYKDKHGIFDLSGKSQSLPTVSFIIAGKNEEDSIYKTIKACMDSEYNGKFECIIVDDGSTDNTLAEMMRAKKDLSTRKNSVKVITFEKNKGKREGMVAGMQVARGELFVFIDSDSFIRKDALNHVVEHFMSDENVGAVSGNTLVENHDANLLTKMQSARYGISFDLFKSCESIFGAVTCCPGCFSAYRSEVVLRVAEDWRNRKVFGTTSTFGDDRSLTNFVLKENMKVIYCREAKASTIVPEEYQKFIKQQLRWKKSWIREGMFGAAYFMWKKHPIASVAFYINLIIPIVGPFIVLYGLFGKILSGEWVSTLLFCLSLSLMSLAYGFYHYAQTKHKDFLYSIPFTLFYSVVLVWQMPWAIIKLNDNSWGTR